jgi:hypothetical protein
LRRASGVEVLANEAVPLSITASLLDLLEQSILISDRTGRILKANSRAKQELASHGIIFESNLNLFSDLLHLEPNVITDQIEDGKQSIDSKFD